MSEERERTRLLYDDWRNGVRASVARPVSCRIQRADGEWIDVPGIQSVELHVTPEPEEDTSVLALPDRSPVIDGTMTFMKGSSLIFEYFRDSVLASRTALRRLACRFGELFGEGLSSGLETSTRKMHRAIDIDRLIDTGVMTSNPIDHPNYRRAARGMVQMSRKQKAADLRARMRTGRNYRR